MYTLHHDAEIRSIDHDRGAEFGAVKVKPEEMKLAKQVDRDLRQRAEPEGLQGRVQRGAAPDHRREDRRRGDRRAGGPGAAEGRRSDGGAAPQPQRRSAPRRRSRSRPTSRKRRRRPRQTARRSAKRRSVRFSCPPKPRSAKAEGGPADVVSGLAGPSCTRSSRCILNRCSVRRRGKTQLPHGFSDPRSSVSCAAVTFRARFSDFADHAASSRTSQNAPARPCASVMSGSYRDLTYELTELLNRTF